MAKCSCKPNAGMFSDKCLYCLEQNNGYYTPQRPNQPSLAASGGAPYFNTHPSASHIPPRANTTVTPSRFSRSTSFLSPDINPIPLFLDDIENPIPQPPTDAHPQLNFIDTQGRTVATFAYLFRGEPTFSVNGRTYKAYIDRNVPEQTEKSFIANLLAPPSKQKIHGSHNARHAFSGDSSRTNIHPVGAYCNTRIIGAFEQQIETQLLNHQTSTIDLCNQQKIYLQVTEAQFNENIVMPYLCNHHTIQKLSTGTPALQKMMQTIRKLASKIPAFYTQTVYCGTLTNTRSQTRVWQQINNPTPLQLKINQILSNPSSNTQWNNDSYLHPRFTLTHLQDSETIKKHEYYLSIIGAAGQFATTEPRSQEMLNILMFQDIKSITEMPYELSDKIQRYSDYEENQWSHMDKVRATATGTPPHIKGGYNEVRDLNEYAFWIIGGPLPQKRNNRSYQPPNNNKRKRSF